MRGPYLYSPKPLHNPASKQYLNDERCALAKNTRVAYRNKWAALQRRFPDRRINEFTTDDLVSFLFTDDAGRKRKPGQMGYGESTFRNSVYAFRSIFKWALKVGHIEVDPTVDLADYKVTQKPSRKNFVWLKENGSLEAVLATCVGEAPRDLRDGMVIQFGVGTGLRSFEIAAARWGHLDNAGMLVVPDGKGGKVRRVAVTPSTLERLAMWRQFVERSQGKPVEPTQPIFPRFRNNGFVWRQEQYLTFVWDVALTGSGILRLVIHRGTLAGYPSLRPHDLRRTHAGLLQDYGMSIEKISQQLGHASVNTTVTYLENNPAKRQEFIAGVSF